MRITVTGVGYVGLVTATCLADAGNHVICVDKDAQKIENLKNGKIPIYEPGLTELVIHNKEAGRLEFTTDLDYGVKKSLIIFIGVGTPPREDGSADISAVLDVTEHIARTMDDYKIIITKSTVPVGTHKIVGELMAEHTEHPFDYVSNPEFLKEGSAVEDFMKPDRVIIGTTNPAVREIMKQLYSPFMRKSNRIMFMDPASAEMTKYAANSMLATRISFMNEISALCDTFGADVECVRQGIGSDPRIGNAFLFPGVGYGGSCFPKDVKALIYMGQQQNCPMTVAQSVQSANYTQHNRFADRIKHYFKDNRNTQLAVWGLAFKAKTDDIRESPAIHCIRQFLNEGMRIKAYDPEAMPASLETLDHEIETCSNSYACLDGSDALIIFTDWQEFRNPDFDLISEKLKRPVIFDGRNLYDPNYIHKIGIEYHCVGRPTKTTDIPLTRS